MKEADLKKVLISNFERGFAILFDAFANQILHLCFNYVKDWGIAEDITQDVFIICYEKFDQFRWDSSIKTWLYRIAINRCKDELKSYRTKHVYPITNLFVFDKAKKQPSPESILTAKREQSLIIKSIFDLPIKYREVILLYYYEELTVKEISEVLSIKESGVKTRLKRARDHLRKKLERSDL